MKVALRRGLQNRGLATVGWFVVFFSDALQSLTTLHVYSAKLTIDIGVNIIHS